MPRQKKDPMAGYTGAKSPKGGPKLKDETRAYTVTEADLSEWLTGGLDPRFYVKRIEVLSSGDIEFTVTTAKQAERTIVERRPYQTVNDQRRQHGLPPLPETDVVDENDLPHDATGLTPNDEGYAGPALDEGGPVGTADPIPMIAKPSETGKARLKSRREINLERQKQGLAPLGGGPNITERGAEEDDPVPSALPR